MQEPLIVNAKQPGRPRENRQSVDQRRQKIYRLWLLGTSVSQIAESLGLNPSSVSRHIEAQRRSGSLMNRTARERYQDVLQETYDAARLSMQEAWRIYLSPETKPELKNALLARIQGGVGLITRFLPDLEAMALEEKIRTVAEEHRIIREAIEEQKQSNKVLPVRTGA
jgi:AcrR family transcriptional regulator